VNFWFSARFKRKAEVSFSGTDLSWAETIRFVATYIEMLVICGLSVYVSDVVKFEGLFVMSKVADVTYLCAQS
jgi:hypothetical protein